MAGFHGAGRPAIDVVGLGGWAQTVILSWWDWHEAVPPSARRIQPEQADVDAIPRSDPGLEAACAAHDAAGAGRVPGRRAAAVARAERFAVTAIVEGVEGAAPCGAPLHGSGGAPGGGGGAGCVHGRAARAGGGAAHASSRRRAHLRRAGAGAVGRWGGTGMAGHRAPAHRAGVRRAGRSSRARRRWLWRVIRPVFIAESAGFPDWPWRIPLRMGSDLREAPWAAAVQIARSDLDAAGL